MAAVSDDILVEAVKARLEEVLPELVAAAELDEIEEYLTYDPPSISAVRTPLVWVDAASSARSNDAGRGATLRKYSVDTTIVVCVVCAGQDQATAVSRLRQYARLVRQAIEGDQTVGGNALWCLWQATDYSPSMAKSGGLVKCAIMTFDCNHRVTLGSE